MLLPFYLQILVPAALGVSLWLFERQFMFVRTAGRAFFVLAQLALIYFCGLASLPGLLIVAALLCGYVTLLGWNKRGRLMYQSLPAIFFAGFLVYWLIQKYLLPLGLDTWLNGWLPWVGRKDSGPYAIMMVGVSYIGF